MSRGTSPCERLASTTTPSAGGRRAAIGRWPAASRFQAPCPAIAPNSSPNAGTPTTPRCARPFRTRPMFTANSFRPAANSRVPSSGSTSQYCADGAVIRPPATSSSAITGISGAAARNPATISASAA